MHHRIKKPGFTLIELLVVISIIALLVAMLLPTLASVRESAKSTVCLSNLRQLSIVSVLYHSDYDDWIPFSYHTIETNQSGFATPSGPAWYVRVAPYLNIPTYDFYRLGGPAYGDWISTPGVFACPGQTPEFALPHERPVSYAPPIRVALRVPQQTGDFKQGRMQWVVSPSKKIWLVDSQLTVAINCGWIHTSYAGTANSISFDSFRRHLEQHANGLFMDMHARTVSYEEAESPSPSVAQPMFHAYEKR